MTGYGYKAKFGGPRQSVRSSPDSRHWGEGPEPPDEHHRATRSDLEEKYGQSAILGPLQRLSAALPHDKIAHRHRMPSSTTRRSDTTGV
jgi:hypothetical protein